MLQRAPRRLDEARDFQRRLNPGRGLNLFNALRQVFRAIEALDPLGLPLAGSPLEAALKAAGLE